MKEKRDKTQLKRVNLFLSRPTHSKIKVYCAQRGVSMQSAIEGWLDKAAEQMAPTAGGGEAK